MAAGAIAVIIELLGDPPGIPITMTVADANAVEKGEIMTMTDPRTVTESTADNDPFAGISAAEKVASDGSTKMPVYTKGIFDINCGAAAGIAIGERVSISGDNEVSKVAAADLLFSDVGIALEAADEDEIFAVLVGSGF